MNKSTSRRVEIIAALLGVIVPTVVTWLYFVALRNCAATLQQTAYAIGKTVQFALPVVWFLALRKMARGDAETRREGTERSSTAEYCGRFIRSPHPSPLPAGEGTTIASIGLGLAFGILAFATIVLAYWLWLGPAGMFDTAGKAITDKVVSFGVRNPAGFAVMAIFYAVVHSLLEEYYWRWFVFGQLRRLMPLWVAIVLSALAFMQHHVIVLAAYFGWSSPATAVFSAGVAIGGMFWAWLYNRSGSLLGPWLGHAMADAAIFVVGYSLVRGVMGW
jgi:membrane protease YdiL (CAAX protease family)